MSEQQQGRPITPSVPLTIDELARLENATVVRDVRELAADIWDDDELDAFLADLRASRRAALT